MTLLTQFFIGGLTVAGISYFSNTLSDTVLAGVIASFPIGMPSTIFVKDQNVSGYTLNLLFMTSILFFVTFTNWFLINKMKYSKYVSVSISLAIWLISGLLYWHLNRK
jgi:ABC-type Mn2+/Zn2+ transport system permease subunit